MQFFSQSMSSAEEKVKSIIQIDDDSSPLVQAPPLLSIMDPKQFPRISSILMKHAQGKNKVKEIKEEVTIEGPVKNDLLAFFIYKQLPRIIEENSVENDVMLDLEVDENPFVSLQNHSYAVSDLRNKLFPESIPVEETVNEQKIEQNQVPVIQQVLPNEVQLFEQISIQIEPEPMKQLLQQQCRKEQPQLEDPNRLIDEVEEQMLQVAEVEEFQRESPKNIPMEIQQVEEEKVLQLVVDTEIQAEVTEKLTTNIEENQSVFAYAIQFEQKSCGQYVNILQNEPIPMEIQKNEIQPQKTSQLEIEIGSNEPPLNTLPLALETIPQQQEKQQIKPQINEVLPEQADMQAEVIAEPEIMKPQQIKEEIRIEQPNLQADSANIESSQPPSSLQPQRMILQYSSPEQPDNSLDEKQKLLASGQYEVLFQATNKVSQKVQSPIQPCNQSPKQLCIQSPKQLCQQLPKQSNHQSPPKKLTIQMPPNPFLPVIKKNINLPASPPAQKKAEVIVIEEAEEVKPLPVKSNLLFIPKTILNKRAEKEKGIEKVLEKTVQSDLKQISVAPMPRIAKDPTENPDYNANPMKMLLDLKNASLSDLRRSMSEYFPENKEIYMTMQYDVLQNMLQVAMDELEDEAIKSKDKEMLTILNEVKEKVNTVVKSTEHSDNHQNGKSQKQKNQKNKNMSIEEMRKFLLKTMPQLASSALQLKDSNHLKMLYDKAVKMLDNQKEKKSLIKKDKDSPTKKKLTYLEVLDMCIEKFPSLREDLKKLTEEEIRKIYEQIQGKANQESKQTTTAAPQQVSQKLAPVIESENEKPNGKRSHEAMMSYKKGQPKKKKINIAELRNKLIEKMPNYKTTIMQFNDEQIEQLYRESVEKPHADAEKEKQKKSKGEIQNGIENGSNKDVHGTKETSHKKMGDGKESQFKEIHNSQAGGGKTKVYEIKANKKKKNRTVVFVHTEEQDSDKQGDQMSKTYQTEAGKQKRGVCECCRKLDVTELMYELINRLPKE